MEYTAIRKGRGFVYAYDNCLYRQVKKHGDVRHLKCCVDYCDGSAKLENGQFKLMVRNIAQILSNVYIMSVNEDCCRFCKVKESILRDHIMDFFSNNHYFSNNQFGFIKGRSTVLCGYCLCV